MYVLCVLCVVCGIVYVCVCVCACVCALWHASACFVHASHMFYACTDIIHTLSMMHASHMFPTCMQVLCIAAVFKGK